MVTRLAVFLNGRQIGTVHLNLEEPSPVLARMAPLPAFKRVSRLRQTIRHAHQRRDWELDEPVTAGQLAAEEGAEAVFGALQLELRNEGGTVVPTTSLELSLRDPPYLTVRW